ncbi:MAG: hypothetical protein HY673_04750 [Chloroflexi bacterium]|nr:hypothetical protein [Chloroflexota bacterium]
MAALRLKVFFRRNRWNRIETRLTGLEVAVGRLTSLVADSPIANVYPEPVATPLALEKGANLHTGRYFSLLDAGEAFIKYSWATAMSLKMSDGDTDLLKELRQPLSIGALVKLLRDVLQSKFVKKNSIGKSLQVSFFQEDGRLTQAGRFFLDEYTNIRNTTRGHSSSLPDGAYEAPYLRHASELHDALGKCSHLQFPLVQIQSANPVGEQINYDVRMLVGPPPFTKIDRIETQSHLRLGGLYVWDRNDIFVDLMNFLICCACPVCHLDHTFFLEQSTGKADKYHSYFGSHRFSIERKKA